VVDSPRGFDCGMEKLGASYVLVQRRWGPFYAGEYTPFCAAAAPSHLHVQWNDARTLVIECNSCGQDYVSSDVNWGKLRFVFDTDRP
jgi:hypothetical protein